MEFQPSLKNILFFDIETVSGLGSYDGLSKDTKKLWNRKAKYLLRRPEEELQEDDFRLCYQEKAGIFAEFGKIVCISAGIFQHDNLFRVKSFFGDDEKELLFQFAEMLNQYFGQPFQKIDFQGNVVGKHFMCGHNIKEFDTPYICRRMMLNQLKLPTILDLQGKKPWESRFQLDTLELWKFGDAKHYTSLNLLTHLFGIPSPKDDIDGSQVGRVYWEDKNLQKIATYCEKDVIATAQLYRRMNYLPLLEEDEIHIL